MTEAELLFSRILNCGRADLYLNRKQKLAKHEAVLISSILKRRILGEPLAYILGNTEFMGLEFKVNKHVLIPRLETELLVEETVSLAADIHVPASGLRILEIGTGSGCIAVSLAKFLHNVSITAIDISSEALKIAKDNAALNEVNAKIDFIVSDLFDACRVPDSGYDMIISNPPYIPVSEIDELEIEISYEPRQALDGGADGLDFYRRIIKEAPLYLKENGLLIMEVGYNQRERIEQILRESRNSLEIMNVVKDYSGIDRVMVIQI